MRVFPSLPVLEATARWWTAEDRRRLGQTSFVCCQHLLETTGSLFETLIDLGAVPSRIFVIGKVYSTHCATAACMRSLGINVRDGTTPAAPGRFDQAIEGDAQAMWRDALATIAVDDLHSKIIVLDDGGHCARSMPGSVIRSRRCVVVEQTSSGMAGSASNGTWQTPVVAVAVSAAKRLLEAPLIVDAVVRRIEQIERYRDGGKVGVLGLGALGRALMASMREKGVPICAFDKREDAMQHAAADEASPSAEVLIQESGMVIGCSGENSVQAEWLPRRQRPLVLASASSGDREFGDVLRRCGEAILPAAHGACADLFIPATDDQCPITVLRGGYPVNFDNSHESVGREQIQLTRGLLLAGVLQALRLAFDGFQGSDAIMLDRTMQRTVVAEWVRAGGRADPILADRFNDDSWIQRESRGLCCT